MFRPSQIADFAVDICQLRDYPLPHNCATGTGVGSQFQKRFDLLQRKAELLRTLDEPDTLDSIGGKDSVARGSTLRLGQQPFALIEADAPKVDAALFRQRSSL
jgi:hypothetical protein